MTLRNLDDMDRIKSWITDNAAKKAVVCGAGFIGVEMAEQLKHCGLEVTLVEGLSQIMAPLDAEMAAQLQAELEKNGVAVVTNAGIVGFEPAAAAGASATASDVVLKDGRRLQADVVILGLGVRPDTALAKAAALPAQPRPDSTPIAHTRQRARCRSFRLQHVAGPSSPKLAGPCLSAPISRRVLLLAPPRHSARPAQPPSARRRAAGARRAAESARGGAEQRQLSARIRACERERGREACAPALSEPRLENV